MTAPEPSGMREGEGVELSTPAKRPDLSVTIDRKTAEMFGNCSTAGFPLCLEKAVIYIFGKKEILADAVALGGYRQRDVNGVKDVWKLYYDYLRSIQNQLGNSVEVVVENQSVKAIEELGCEGCPLLAFGRRRGASTYTLGFPPESEILNAARLVESMPPSVPSSPQERADSSPEAVGSRGEWGSPSTK